VSYDEHYDQDVLLGDLRVREDGLQDGRHVRLVFLPQLDHTLVVVSCGETERRLPLKNYETDCADGHLKKKNLIGVSNTSSRLQFTIVWELSHEQ